VLDSFVEAHVDTCDNKSKGDVLFFYFLLLLEHSLTFFFELFRDFGRLCCTVGENHHLSRVKVFHFRFEHIREAATSLDFQSQVAPLTHVRDGAQISQVENICQLARVMVGTATEHQNRRCGPHFGSETRHCVESWAESVYGKEQQRV